MNDALERGDIAAEIPGEAEKTEAEFRHVLDWDGEAVLTCARAAMREDGHHVYVTATLKREVPLNKPCPASSNGRKSIDSIIFPAAPINR